MILENGWSEYAFEDKKKKDPITLIKRDRVGALQISLAINKDASDGNLQVFEHEENKEGKFIKFIELRKPNVHVVCTYVSNEDKMNSQELNEAISMAKSIEIIIRNRNPQG